MNKYKLLAFDILTQYANELDIDNLELFNEFAFNEQDKKDYIKYINFD